MAPIRVCTRWEGGRGDAAIPIRCSEGSVGHKAGALALLGVVALQGVDLVLGQVGPSLSLPDPWAECVVSSMKKAPASPAGQLIIGDVGTKTGAHGLGVGSSLLGSGSACPVRRLPNPLPPPLKPPSLPRAHPAAGSEPQAQRPQPCSGQPASTAVQEACPSTPPEKGNSKHRGAGVG